MGNMSKTNTAVTVGGLITVGLVGFLLYKAYQKGRVNGHAEGYKQASQRYEYEIQNLKDENRRKDNIIQQKIAEVRQQTEQTVIRDAEIIKLKEELKRISEK